MRLLLLTCALAVAAGLAVDQPLETLSASSALENASLPTNNVTTVVAAAEKTTGAMMTAWLTCMGAATATVMVSFVSMLAGLPLVLAAVGGSKARAAWGAALADVVEFYKALLYFLKGNSLKGCPYFLGRRQARVQVYSLVLVFRLWDVPHYRNGTFQEDCIKNLRNVAIPGTGVPLSVFARSKLLAYLFLFVAYPITCLVAGLNQGRVARSAAVAGRVFREQLTEPLDWFSFWRLNCRLATYHSAVSQEVHGEASVEDYKQEDKWTFLRRGKKEGIAVTPWLDLPGLVVKHRNEEGGMGFQRFGNATAGGDWIIQPQLSNGATLRKLLPENAPLSTFRVITASRGGLSANRGMSGKDCDGLVEALSCVWRAGRAGAATDHSSILFDVVDTKTGKVGRGTTNAHWYKLGPSKVLTTNWLSHHDHTHHPDSGVPITGAEIKEMPEVMALAAKAHARMCPAVPLVGWDVALTEEHGMLLLEGNFSCNFFRGSFDKPAYFKFVEDFFVDLDGLKTRE